MKVLLLAGTGDARRIAAALNAVPDIHLIASLAGATRQPRLPDCETRIGGFGGAEGFANYLKTTGIDLVVDATHPFAARMSTTAARICYRQAVPHIQMLRPQWQPGAGDRWTLIADEAEAAEHIPVGATVFVATGRQTLAGYGNMTGRRLICRQIDPANEPFPFPDGEFLIGRPPFSIEDEIALFRRLNIDWLVVKNSGGAASRSKLDAARALGLPVAMIRRPDQPDCHRASRVEEVLAFVTQHQVHP